LKSSVFGRKKKEWDKENMKEKRRKKKTKNCKLIALLLLQRQVVK